MRIQNSRVCCSKLFVEQKTVTETVTMKRFHFLLLALACCDARPLIRMIRDQREFDKVRDRRAAGKSLDG